MAFTEAPIFYSHNLGDGGINTPPNRSSEQNFAQPGALKELPEIAGIPHDPNDILLNRINESTETFRGLTPDHVLDSSVRLTLAARADALKRIPTTPDLPTAVRRVDTALANRFLPYVVEANITAEQLSLQRSKDFTYDTLKFLGNPIIAIIACPDGRIIAFALGDPGVVSINRRLGGRPPIRPSTEDGTPVLDDPDISGAINFGIEQRSEPNTKAELIEMWGPHIFSSHPVHGCGDVSTTFGTDGHFEQNAMKYGGIKEYFELLGEGFFAANNNAARAGGLGTTFDLVHDAHSQGLIFGLRQAYRNFDQKLDLRHNLLNLAEADQILMTELLRNAFRVEIRTEAARLRLGHLDISDPTQFADNRIAVGEIAQAITKRERVDNFTWIPAHLKEGKSPTAILCLAYQAVRNTVYQELTNIKAGSHSLTRHPEGLIVAGSVVPLYNVNTIPFIQKTSRGSFSEEDVRGIKRLYGLSGRTMPEIGIDLTQESRIMIVLDGHDPDDYANTKIAQREKHKTAALVRNNAARIRGEYGGSVATGETVVIGAMVKPGPRGITHVV